MRVDTRRLSERKAARVCWRRGWSFAMDRALTPQEVEEITKELTALDHQRRAAEYALSRCPIKNWSFTILRMGWHEGAVQTLGEPRPVWQRWMVVDIDGWDDGTPPWCHSWQDRLAYVTASLSLQMGRLGCDMCPWEMGNALELPLRESRLQALRRSDSPFTRLHFGDHLFEGVEGGGR